MIFLIMPDNITEQTSITDIFSSRIPPFTYYRLQRYLHVWKVCYYLSAVIDNDWHIWGLKHSWSEPKVSSSQIERLWHILFSNPLHLQSWAKESTAEPIWGLWFSQRLQVWHKPFLRHCKGVIKKQRNQKPKSKMTSLGRGLDCPTCPGAF